MNRLVGEISPYLLQHAGNPVDWYPWDKEALERARAEDKPILLSVGYAACHWCHVMERESFEDAATAALMNEHFVCVKVDREERPDIDAVYMDAVVALSGHGGWPMTVFLTPDREPFFGGTYFPPEPRHGLPAFRQVLLAVAEAWRDRRDDAVASARNLTDHIRAGAARTASDDGQLTPELLEEAERNLRDGFDPTWGGWGRAPKFPPAPVLELLLRRGEEEMTRRTLDGMALGGMHDLVGGGFHRYSVDERWLVPHFEKMLYDNALLASVYLRAARRFDDDRYRAIAERTLDYLERELALDGGGFASAQDADTDGVEGLTYTWAPGEGAPDELLQPFEGGRFVLRGELDDETRARLLAIRERRPKPARDDKAVAAWNGLALAAFAQAGRIETANRLAAFLLGPLSTPDGRLHRTWRAGAARGTGYLDDYAAAAHGLLELHVASGDPAHLREAHRLATLAVELFADEEYGGFFQTARDAERLVARKKEVEDHPTPSGSSLLAYVLLRLARIWGDAALEARALSALALVRDMLTRAPTAFGWALVALDQHLAPHRELAIVGPPGAPVARAALEAAAPTDVVAFGPADDVPLLAGRGLVEGRPAVYVCERFACRAPVTEPSALATS
ncbi:MAG TPA: thioredoxin domain-containing protein [Gaiellaceae bacterium]|nr:thioredoxin domain-containing protein [Gaiellaceae bacterium]HZU20437.1 thioredoxin domain-containing protein [Gaiellaceae bacterium]